MERQGPVHNFACLGDLGRRRKARECSGTLGHPSSIIGNLADGCWEQQPKTINQKLRQTSTSFRGPHPWTWHSHRRNVHAPRRMHHFACPRLPDPNPHPPRNNKWECLYQAFALKIHQPTCNQWWTIRSFSSINCIRVEYLAHYFHCTIRAYQILMYGQLIQLHSLHAWYK